MQKDLFRITRGELFRGDTMTSRDAIAMVAIACVAALIAGGVTHAQSAPQKLLVGSDPKHKRV